MLVHWHIPLHDFLCHALALVVFIDHECNKNTALKARIKALLHSHSATNSFLHDQPFVLESNETMNHHPAPKTPDTIINPYKLLKQINKNNYNNNNQK